MSEANEKPDQGRPGILAEIRCEDQYSALYEDDAIWQPAVREIAACHGLEGDPERLTRGTHLVYGIGGVVLKIYCPLWAASFEAERVALESVDNLPVPRVVAHGRIGEWPYLVQSRAVGVPAQSIWRKLSRGARRSLVGEIGALLRCLHDHPLPKGLDSDWGSFLQARLSGAEGHHGARDPWGRWIRSRLEEFVEPPLRHVFLHADLTADHILLTRRDDGSWFVSGIVDFGDARIGHPFYDFIAVIAHYTLGEPELSHQLLEAYAMECSSEVEEGILSFCLLHEFGRLQDFLDAHSMEGPADFRRALWGKDVPDG